MNTRAHVTIILSILVEGMNVEKNHSEKVCQENPKKACNCGEIKTRTCCKSSASTTLTKLSKDITGRKPLLDYIKKTTTNKQNKTNNTAKKGNTSYKN